MLGSAVHVTGVFRVTQFLIGVRFIVAAFILALSGITAGQSMAQQEEVEQPPYEVIGEVGSIEIRQYGPRLAAEAYMGPGSGVNDGQYSAFMVLANFIFAKDRQGASVDMTAPVAIEGADDPIAMTAPVSIEQAEEPIAMTAPVAMEPGDEGRVMRFFMPAEYTLETLPKPGDDRVRIITVPAQTLAVIRFAGDADDEEVAKRKADLLAGLEGGAWEPVGEPGFFGYDAPMTPPAQRRNEVFVEVAAIDAAGTPDNG